MSFLGELPADASSVGTPTSVMEGGRPTFSRRRYPGLNGVLHEMKKLVQKFRGNPIIRDKAMEITGSISSDSRTGLPNRRDFDAIAGAVYTWMNAHIQYVRDPVNVEWLQSPDVTLQKGYGDCDDHSILAASLLESIGVPSRFVIVKANPYNRSQYSHVYVEYLAEGTWKPFDTTLHSSAGLGVPSARVFGRRTIDLSGLEPVKKKAA